LPYRARLPAGAFGDGAHSYAGLGYNGALSATVTTTNWVESSFTTSAFQVVNFNTHGTDPISSATIPPFTAYRVGISPVILIDNRTNTSGLGAKNTSGKFFFTNLTSAEASNLWSGEVSCDTSVFGVSGAPVVNLTVNEREQTAELLNRISKNRSVIVIEHDMEFVRKIADKVTVLHQGKVIAEGSMEKVTADPRVIEVYLGH